MIGYTSCAAKGAIALGILLWGGVAQALRTAAPRDSDIHATELQCDDLKNAGRGTSGKAGTMRALVLLVILAVVAGGCRREPERPAETQPAAAATRAITASAMHMMSRRKTFRCRSAWRAVAASPPSPSAGTTSRSTRRHRHRIPAGGLCRSACDPGDAPNHPAGRCHGCQRYPLRKSTGVHPRDLAFCCRG